MKSDREHDGLVGPVQAVVIELEDCSEQEGDQTFGPRTPLLTLRYDVGGKRVGERSYSSLHRESAAGDCVATNDTEGKIGALFCFANGRFLNKVMPTYDDNNRIIKELFCDALGNPSYQREHEYDLRGNPIRMTYAKMDGTISDKLKYENEYDSVGNLIKTTILRWSTENGNSFYKPTTITHRTITYY